MRVLALCIFLLSGCAAFAQESYFPPRGNWERRLNDGFNEDLLNRAIEFALSNEYSGSRDLRVAILEGFASEPYHQIKGPVKRRGGPAGLIVRNGYIVGEWGDPERVDMTFSVTKSYLSTVVGLAVDKGLIGSTKETAGTYVWDGTFDGDHNGTITWHHLLNQSSDWSGNLFGMDDWADRPPREGGIDEWKNRELHTPGTVFEYNDVRVNVLAYSALQVWRKPLPQVLKEHIMDKIGASSTWRWFGYDHAWVNVDGTKVQSVTGGGHSGGGVFINTYDHARFGLLFARGGLWDKDSLISASWIEMARKPSEARENYGYMWWLNGTGSWEGVPGHVYYAAGFGGNFIVIDDQRDLVIVTRWLQPSEIGTFVKMVYDALD